MARKTHQPKILTALFQIRSTRKEKETLFENLGEMISAGIEINNALAILKSEVSSKATEMILDRIASDIDNGNSIWRSFANAKLLQDNYLSIIRIGEESGRLPENAQIVVKQINKDREFRERLQSASLYPIFILIVMISVGLGLAFFVLPRLSIIYSSLNVDLPWITKVLIAFGDFLGKYGAIAIPSFIAVMLIGFYLLFIYHKTKFIGQKLLLGTPVVRRIIIEIEISRLGVLLGTLLSSGFPILESLKLMEASTGYIEYQKFYRFLYDQIEQGYSFQDAFEHYPKSHKLIPLYARQLVISAQQTGHLPEQLVNIGTTYEKKNDNSTKDLSSLLEPVLLVIIWVGVAFIALAVILPIYSLIGNITDLASQRNADIQVSENAGSSSTSSVSTAE